MTRRVSYDVVTNLHSRKQGASFISSSEFQEKRCPGIRGKLLSELTRRSGCSWCKGDCGRWSPHCQISFRKWLCMRQGWLWWWVVSYIPRYSYGNGCAWCNRGHCLLGENGSPSDASRTLEWSLTAIPPRILHLKKADTTIGMNLYLGTQWLAITGRDGSA